MGSWMKRSSVTVDDWTMLPVVERDVELQLPFLPCHSLSVRCQWNISCSVLMNRWSHDDEHLFQLTTAVLENVLMLTVILKKKVTKVANSRDLMLNWPSFIYNLFVQMRVELTRCCSKLPLFYNIHLVCLFHSSDSLLITF